MRLSTRFGLGSALALLPLLLVTAYGAERLRMLSIKNRELSTRQLVEFRIDSGVIARLERVEEFARKHAVSRDPQYLGKSNEILRAIEEEVARLDAGRLLPSERAALLRLKAHLARFGERASLAERNPEEIGAELEEVIASALAVQDEARKWIEREAELAERTSDEVRMTAAVAAGSAILLSLALLFFTARSLRRRIETFIRGTQAVARGKFAFRLRADSDDETGRLAEAFNAMVRDLSQLDRLKADFISSVSHELRTPIVAMIETNRFLLDELAGPLSERQRHMLELNTQSAQRLSAMIGDLLDLSRLKAGIRYHVAAHDLAELTRRAALEFEAVALKKEISLSVQTDARAPASVDADRYVQVVQNLVENALKYTPSGGVVQVGLTVRDPRHLPPESALGHQSVPYAHLVVEDSGSGIPESERQRVFDKFFRRRGVASDGGVGLGLAITREIVEAHEGSIWISSSESLEGAALHVALPAKTRPSRSVRSLAA